MTQNFFSLLLHPRFGIRGPCCIISLSTYDFVSLFPFHIFIFAAFTALTGTILLTAFSFDL